MNASAQPISPFHHLQQQQQTSSSGSSTPQQNQQQMSQQNNNNNKPPSSKSSTNLRRGPWSPDEDRKLIESINLFGATNWVRISQALGSRTPKQCRERYHQNLKPSLNRNPISPEEGQLIEELVAKYGKRWAEIARHLNDYPQQHPPHFNSPSFNTQIFQQNQQGQGQHLLQQPFHSLPPNQHQTLPPLHATQSTPAAPTNSSTSSQQQQPLMLLSSLSQQQMLPPANVARSASLNQEIFQQQQPGVKRFLEEQHIPLRRHSAQTILTSNPTSSSPFSASPLSRGPSSRNSSISYDYQQQQQPHTQPTSQSGYFSEYSNNTSRRSSIAHDIFPNPFQYQNKRQNSTTSSTSIPPTNAVYLSPSFKPHRGSASGLPSNLSTLSSNNTTSSNETTPIFKSDFGFECKNDEQDGEGKGDGKKKVMNINNLLG
ncbi:unnamed protein product [Wickerhamomyces anomalus]